MLRVHSRSTPLKHPPSQIAEVGVGKFCDGPVGGIGEVAHIRFLEHLVELGEMMENRLQNTSSPSKLKNVSNCQLTTQMFVEKRCHFQPGLDRRPHPIEL